MLANYNCATFIPASDLARARRFYAEKLEFQPVQELDGVLLYQSGGTQFAVYATQFAGFAQHTLMSWDVDDLDAVMAHLRQKGVVFEEYDMPGLKTVNGVAEFGPMRGAWFKESEGNILNVTQRG
jgi:catechol 2,3-dioxygenase-like lactoylglutathione lyase family enzyme